MRKDSEAALAFVFLDIGFRYFFSIKSEFDYVN
jgi:hypothetical protein